MQRSIGNRATARLVQRNGNIHTLADLKKKEGATSLTLRLRPPSAEGADTKSETATTARQSAPITSAFSGEGRRLSESTFTNDEERESERKAAYAGAQARYSTGQTPFGGPVDDSNAFSVPEHGKRSPSPSSPTFSGEGHRLSDWSFESDEERDSERRAALATGQARYSAGLAPFEGEMDLSRIPWAPRTDEQSSPPPRMSSVLESAVRSRRPFSSGATESEIDPLGHIQDNLIPSSSFHGPMKSELRKRRLFASGVSEEYLSLKSARAEYQQEVDSTISNRRREQPRSVGALERLWIWTNADIDDSTEETEHRHRQLPRIEQLLITIRESHDQIETKRKEADQRYIQQLLADIDGLSAQVGLFLKDHYELLSSNNTWWKQYVAASQYFDILRHDPSSQNDENLVALRKTWQGVHGAAQQQITIAASSSTAALKIGLDPSDASDRATVYSYYVQTGGSAPDGQVRTVCEKAGKHGGTYTYKGKRYDMYHDSHGPKEGNSNESRTAWKISIDGKLLVVGIGHHVPGAAKYRAIFPRATDPSVQEYGPSPDITDSRK